MARQLGDSVQAWFWIGTPLTASGNPATYTLVKATHLAAGAKLSDNATIQWSDQGEQIDVTALEDKNRQFLDGKGTVDIAASFWYNLDSNALQKTLVRGATGMLIIRPDNKSGAVEFVVPAKVLGRTFGAQVNQGLPFDVQFVAVGDLIQQDITVVA